MDCSDYRVTYWSLSNSNYKYPARILPNCNQLDTYDGFKCRKFTKHRVLHHQARIILEKPLPPCPLQQPRDGSAGDVYRSGRNNSASAAAAAPTADSPNAGPGLLHLAGSQRRTSATTALPAARPRAGLQELALFLRLMVF